MTGYIPSVLVPISIGLVIDAIRLIVRAVETSPVKVAICAVKTSLIEVIIHTVEVIAATGKVIVRFIVHVSSLKVYRIICLPHEVASCFVCRLNLLELICLPKFVGQVAPLELFGLKLYIKRVSHSVAH